MGLSDVRKAVALMSLTAAGRVELQDATDPSATTGASTDGADLDLPENYPTSSHAGPSAPSLLQLAASLGHDSALDNNYSALPHLRSAIAALAQADKTASNLVLHMCTKVFRSS